MAGPIESLLLRPREVARMLQLDDNAVYGMLDSGELGFIPRGKNRRMVPRREVEAWIERNITRAG